MENILENGFVQSDELIWVISGKTPKKTRLSHSDKTISFYEVTKSVDVSDFFDEVEPIIKKKS